MSSKISIHTFMHVPFEGLGCIENWISKKEHSVSFTKFYEPFKLPNLDDIDWLIVMGGPMGVYDDAQYTWLVDEKDFIRKAISNGKTVIGICLGSQLIAEVLGAKVFPNHQKEIGWFDIKMTEPAAKLAILDGFENRFKVFHWHGDTFDLPKESIGLLSSDVCKNQAYLFRENVLGLQFHFEVTPTSLAQMIENGMSELVENETIQSADQIVNNLISIDSNNNKMFKILDYFEQQKQ